MKRNANASEDRYDDDSGEPCDVEALQAEMALLWDETPAKLNRSISTGSTTMTLGMNTPGELEGGPGDVRRDE